MFYYGIIEDAEISMFIVVTQLLVISTSAMHTNWQKCEKIVLESLKLNVFYMTH